MLENETHQV